MRSLIWLLVGAILAGLIAVRISNPTNVAETSPDHTNPRLRTRRYQLHTDLHAMRREIKELIPGLTTYGRHWRVVEVDEETAADGSEVVRAEVPVFFFTDDLRVGLRRGGNVNEVLIDVRSASRVGRSDLGENRRHVIELLSALDERFGK